MEKKMSSDFFNDMLEKSKENIDNMNKKIDYIKTNIDKKILVINHENDFLNYCLNQMTYMQPEDATYILLNNNYKGLYDSYSNIIHPAFKKEPINIFNLKAINNNKIFFRDEVTVSINDIAKDYYKNILKDDSLENKEIFFEEYKTDNIIQKNELGEYEKVKDNKIKISIEINKDKVLGISKFNMIEIDPYLYTSFNIEHILIYGENYDKPIYTSNAINKVGKTRIVLDKKYEFRKVEFIIEPKYIINKNNEEVIPFGLKHIYFYETDFRNDSYIIIKYDSDKYIDNIKNKVDIITPFGTIESSLKKEGIKIYLENKNGLLENEQEPSENIKKPIARNMKQIFFKVPLSINSNDYLKTCIIALKFYMEYR